MKNKLQVIEEKYKAVCESLGHAYIQVKKLESWQRQINELLQLSVELEREAEKYKKSQESERESNEKQD